MKVLMKVLKWLLGSVLATFVCLLAFIVSMMVPVPSRTDLVENVNKSKAELIKEWSNHPLFTKEKPRVFVYTSVASYLTSDESLTTARVMSMTNSMYLSHENLNDPCLDRIVFHELGHLQNASGDQMAAEYFAVRVLGKDRVLSCIYENYDQNIPPDKNISEMYAWAVWHDIKSEEEYIRAKRD